MKSKVAAKSKLIIALVPLVFVGFVLITTNFGSSYANAKNRVGSASESDAVAVYSKYCARCHGADGTAKTAKGKQTRATDLTKSTIGNAAGIRVISNGKELMPGFKGDLSAEEMQGVMTYVRGFRK